MAQMHLTTETIEIIFGNFHNLKDSDIWDTDYNSDNWEPELMTIFVIWELIVTLDSIRNSCDVSSVFWLASRPLSHYVNYKD